MPIAQADLISCFRDWPTAVLERMSLVQNEQIKLTAGWLNAMASAAVVAGIIVPAAAAFYGVGGYDHEGTAWRFLASACLWISSGSILHYIARRTLRRLQS